MATSLTLLWPQRWGSCSEVPLPWGRTEGCRWVLGSGQPWGLYCSPVSVV